MNTFTPLGSIIIILERSDIEVMAQIQHSMDQLLTM